MAFRPDFFSNLSTRKTEEERQRQRLEFLASRTKFATGDMEKDIRNFLRMKTLARMILDMLEPDNNLQQKNNG